MSKLSGRLPKKEVEKMFYKLCAVIAKTNSIEDAAKLLRDLLSFTEAEIIAKRIKIAEMLLEEKTYSEIIKKLKVSSTTIFKVQEWLSISGDGYREALRKTKNDNISREKREEYSPKEWMSMKKKYPMYYWPEILLENIVATSNKKQKRKLESVLNQMEKMKEKSELYGRIKKILKNK